MDVPGAFLKAPIADSGMCKITYVRGICVPSHRVARQFYQLVVPKKTRLWREEEIPLATGTIVPTATRKNRPSE